MHPEKSNPNALLQYEFRIKGYLNQNWSDWFSGLTVSHDATGNTLLTGDVVDQAQLYGLIKRIRDAGMELISVNSITETDDL